MTLPDFLTRDPDGEVRLTGHRIGLYTVVRCYQQGFPAERIADEFPSLPLALVYKVLAFYLANRADVDPYVAAYGAQLDRQAAQPGPGPDLAELQRRWKALGLGKLP
jgi:uncharacterized protein (DUF433 family)